MRAKPALSEMAALKAYLKVRIEDGSGRLFTGQKGPLQRWTLTRMFRSLCAQVSQSRVRRGLQPIAANAMHFHSLKHSIATILASGSAMASSPTDSSEALSGIQDISGAVTLGSRADAWHSTSSHAGRTNKASRYPPPQKIDGIPVYLQAVAADLEFESNSEPVLRFVM
jgi:integrase